MARQGALPQWIQTGSLHLKVNLTEGESVSRSFFPHWKITEATAICADLQIHLNIGDAHFRKAQIYPISSMGSTLLTNEHFTQNGYRKE